MSIFSIFFFVVLSLFGIVFFAVMSHLTKFAWFYFPFHSIGGGRGFKLIWKKIPCFINVCKTNAFPNNSAAALIDKQTDIQFAIMAVFSLYCIRIEWLFFTPSTFGIWYVYISYMLIIYVGRFCVCVIRRWKELHLLLEFPINFHFGKRLKFQVHFRVVAVLIYKQNYILLFFL